MNSYFIMQSIGRSGTQWFSKTINQHPDVYCAHGPDLNPFSNESPNQRFIRIHEETSKFINVNVDEYFDMMEQNIKKKCLGTVHSFDTLQVYGNSYSLRRNYHLSSMIRNPIHRIESFISRNRKEIQLDNRCFYGYWKKFEECKNLLNHVRHLVKHVDFYNPDNFLYVLAAYRTISNDEFMSYQNINIYQFERMTSELDYFLLMTNEISGRSLSIHSDFIKSVETSSPVDQITRKTSAYDKFMSWPEWKQVFFSKLLAQRDILNFYRKMGYDLCYVLS